MMQFTSPEELVDFVKYFRADNIVNDCEFIRVSLVPHAEPWTVLGQVNKLIFSVKMQILRNSPSGNRTVVESFPFGLRSFDNDFSI